MGAAIVLPGIIIAVILAYHALLKASYEVHCGLIMQVDAQDFRQGAGFHELVGGHGVLNEDISIY